MTNIKEIENNPSSETDQSFQKGVSTYKQKRIFWPIVVGMCVLLITAHPFIAFVAYIVFGLFYDWLTFKFDNCRDSEEIPAPQLVKEQITGEEYDSLNNFLVKLRQAAFALSVSVTAFSFLFFEDTNYQLIFVATYISITTVAIFCGIETEEIAYPYIEANKENSSVSKRDNFNRLDITSSAAYWPGGVLDPNRHN